MILCLSRPTAHLRTGEFRLRTKTKGWMVKTLSGVGEECMYVGGLFLCSLQLLDEFKCTMNEWELVRAFFCFALPRLPTLPLSSFSFLGAAL